MSNKLWCALSAAGLSLACAHARPQGALDESVGLKAARQQARYEHRLGQLEAELIAFDARLQALQAQLRGRQAHLGDGDVELPDDRWVPKMTVQQQGAARAPLVIGRGSKLRVDP